MEAIFHISKADDFNVGTFGTLYECAKWALDREGIDEAPDSDDPMLSAETLIEDFDYRYQLTPAEVALPKSLRLDEAVLLDSAPLTGLSDVKAWLESGSFDNATLRQMADILHARIVGVRLRGSVHSVGNSPLTNEQYELLQRQLS